MTAQDIIESMKRELADRKCAIDSRGHLSIEDSIMLIHKDTRYLYSLIAQILTMLASQE